MATNDYSDKDIKRLKQASEFTAFYRKLGVLLGPYLNMRWSLIDLGCGLALTDFEIADRVSNITAVDVDKRMIAEVESKIDELMLQGSDAARKIKVLAADAMNLPDGEWDVALISFPVFDYSEIASLITKARKRCLIVVPGRKPNGKFDPMPADVNKIIADDLEMWLAEQGYKFKKTVVDLQFGQPFKTIEDIHDFLEAYSDEDSLPVAEGFDPEKQMLSAEERIIKTDRYDYPFYLPKNYSVGIFAVIM